MTLHPHRNLRTRITNNKISNSIILYLTYYQDYNLTSLSISSRHHTYIHHSTNETLRNAFLNSYHQTFSPFQATLPKNKNSTYTQSESPFFRFAVVIATPVFTPGQMNRPLTKDRQCTSPQNILTLLFPNLLFILMQQQRSPPR